MEAWRAWLKKTQIRLNLEVSSFYKIKARGRNRLKGILIGSSLLGIDPQSSSSAQAKKWARPTSKLGLTNVRNLHNKLYQALNRGPQCLMNQSQAYRLEFSSGSSRRWCRRGSFWPGRPLWAARWLGHESRGTWLVQWKWKRTGDLQDRSFSMDDLLRQKVWLEMGEKQIAKSPAENK